MTTAIIITVCILLLLAYVFDITSTKTKIPSVILLLLLGWIVRQVTIFFDFQIPNLNPALPILGTIGLILIVLEGSLELEIDRTRVKLISKSFFLAIVPMLLLSFGMAYAFQYFRGVPFKIGLANAIPLTIISSAIAIPSAKNLLSKEKEFITYESSLSDIIGVVFFNFITINEIIDSKSVGYFAIDMSITLLISFIAIIGLSFLISKIKQHVKFVPIILLIVLIYSISKAYHLPALILILLFGLFLGNVKKLKRFKILERLHPETLEKEVEKFKELTIELTFLIRALFFLLFGYLINTSELLDLNTIIWAIAISSAILLIRALFLFILRLPFQPYLFMAPRGLITILLFLSIPIEQTFDLANNSLMIQVILISAFIMMFGIMKNKKVQPEVEKVNDDNIIEDTVNKESNPTD